MVVLVFRDMAPRIHMGEVRYILNVQTGRRHGTQDEKATMLYLHTSRTSAMLAADANTIIIIIVILMKSGAACSAGGFGAGEATWNYLYCRKQHLGIFTSFLCLCTTVNYAKRMEWKRL